MTCESSEPFFAQGTISISRSRRFLRVENNEDATTYCALCDGPCRIGDLEDDDVEEVVQALKWGVAGHTCKDWSAVGEGKGMSGKSAVPFCHNHLRV